MKIYQSASTNPVLNSAIEEWLFRHPERQEPTLLFYRNERSVLFGRNQNPWLECDVQFCRNHGICLVRRISGGGTVFHDEGNLNVSLILPRKQYDPDRLVQLLLETFRRLGIPEVRCDEHNSVFSGNRKICGTAYAVAGQAALLHACILVNADVELLHRVLQTPNHLRIDCRCVASNRVPVARLSQFDAAITCEKVQTALIDSAVGQFCAVDDKDSDVEVVADSNVRTINDVETIHVDDVLGNEGFQTSLERFSGDDWTFGHSGDFRATFVFDGGTMVLEVAGGKVAEGRIETADGVSERFDAAVGTSFHQVVPQVSEVLNSTGFSMFPEPGNANP